MTQKEKEIEIPFGANDSELIKWEYTIPEGMKAEIKDGKVIIKKAESEDERIRKGLIEALKASKTIGELKFIFPEPTREECIAYLEKQNDVPSRETTLGIWKLGNFWKENQVERDGLTQLQYIQKYLCLGLKNATIDYLKEQKPAGWSEEDKHNLNSVINLVHATTDGAWGSCIGDSVENWLKSLPERFNIQPKPEVEGDNETEIQKAYREGKNAGRKEVFDHPEYYGLQLRRVYDYETGKRNPEWSEEDEKIMETIIKEGYLKPSEIAWLKSLRSHSKSSDNWKPSEEQPEVFDTVAFQKGVQEGRRLEREDALTIADIEKLHTFLYAVKNNKQGVFTFTRLSDEQYEEVLKRFNNAKEK